MAAILSTWRWVNDTREFRGQHSRDFFSDVDVLRAQLQGCPSAAVPDNKPLYSKHHREWLYYLQRLGHGEAFSIRWRHPIILGWHIFLPDRPSLRLGTFLTIAHWCHLPLYCGQWQLLTKKDSIHMRFIEIVWPLIISPTNCVLHDMRQNTSDQFTCFAMMPSIQVMYINIISKFWKLPLISDIYGSFQNLVVKFITH